MTGIVMPRRRFLTGLVGLIAAPAVVRAESLMPVKALPIYVGWDRGVEILPADYALKLSDYVSPPVFARYDEFSNIWKLGPLRTLTDLEVKLKNIDVTAFQK